MKYEDGKTIRKAMHLLRKWVLLFEAPEWSADEMEDAEIILSILKALNEYSDRIASELCAYSYDEDPVAVNLLNPLPYIKRIEKEVMKGELIGASRLRGDKNENEIL